MARARDVRDDDRDDQHRDEPDDSDESDDQSDDTDQDESDDDDDRDEPDESAETIKDLKRQLLNQKRANRRLRAGQRDGDRRPPARSRDDRDQDDDDDRDRRDRRDEERREVKAERTALVARAEAALLRAGCDPDVADVLAEKVRTRDVDFDDDERPDFGDWIDELREDRPSAFRRRRVREEEDDDEPRQRRRRPSVDQDAASGGGRRRQQEPPKSLGARMIAAGRRADGIETTSRRRAR